MKIKNILVVCVVVIVVNLFLFNKKAISQSSVDGGDIVMMNIQNEEIVLVYHKPSNSILLYASPALNRADKGLQLLQIRSLSSDLELAEKLAEVGTELVWKKNGYNLREINNKTKNLN